MSKLMTMGSLAISPDAGLMVDKKLQIWDAGTGDLFKNFKNFEGNDSEAICAAFHPEGTLLAIGSTDKLVRIWELESGKLRSSLSGHEYQVNLIRKVKLEIAVNDEFVDPTIEAIIRGGRSGPEGKIGDGKIFLMPLEDVIRIRTGERGGEAI